MNEDDLSKALHLLGTTTHPKLQPLLQELGHDDLIPTFS